MAASKRPPRAARSDGSDDFQAGPGTIVGLAYELFDAEGESIEVSSPDEPVEVLLGYGDAAPRVEAALQGLTVGGSREITLAPEDAFGARDPDGMIHVDRSDLPDDIVLGDEFEAERQGAAGVVMLKVVELTDDTAVLDTNHPLAGQQIRVRLVVQSIRPAEEQEIEAAVRRLEEGDQNGHEALLPAERLLRRRTDPGGPGGDEPPPPPPDRVA